MQFFSLLTKYTQNQPDTSLALTVWERNRITPQGSAGILQFCNDDRHNDIIIP